jgi:outer membrane protein assembly factor BamD (BamD/ComL family)
MLSLNSGLCFVARSEKLRAQILIMEAITESPALYNAWAWVERNRKQLLAGVLVVAAVVIFLGYNNWAKAEHEKTASQTLSRVLFQQADKQVTGGAADEFLKVATAHRGTKAAGQALLLAAADLFKAGKFAEAQTAFDQFRRDHPNNLLAAQALYGAAAALAAQSKWDEAAQLYQSSLDRFPASPVANQARYSLAAAYAAQGKIEEAVKRYEEVAMASSGNSLGNEALLRADELREQLPPITAPESITIPDPIVPTAQP